MDNNGLNKYQFAIQQLNKGQQTLLNQLADHQKARISRYLAGEFTIGVGNDYQTMPITSAMLATLAYRWATYALTSVDEGTAAAINDLVLLPKLHEYLSKFGS